MGKVEPSPSFMVSMSTPMMLKMRFEWEKAEKEFGMWATPGKRAVQWPMSEAFYLWL